MHEDAAMQVWRPGPDVPRGHSGPRQKPVKHAKKCLGRDRGDAVERKTAPALLDKPNSVDLGIDYRASWRRRELVYNIRATTSACLRGSVRLPGRLGGCINCWPADMSGAVWGGAAAL